MKNNQKSIDLIPANRELKKFIESGGNPDARSYFDDLTKTPEQREARETGEKENQTPLNA